jgi:predicted SPOUT superfamily RNA methylase MTH1
MGVYWGYNVRIEKKISNVFSKEYDYVIGTSEVN